MRVYTNMVCVYTHSVNGRVFYVGKGNAQRVLSSLNRNSIWYEIVNKYRGFTLQILAWYADKEAALRREVLEIKKRKPAANLMHNGLTRSPAQRAAISRARLGRGMSEEHKRRIGAANRGKKRTPEQCARMAAAQRRRHAALPEYFEMVETLVPNK